MTTEIDSQPGAVNLATADVELVMPQDLPSHVQWLFARMGDRLDAELLWQGARLSPRAFLKILCDADPGSGKQAVQWLAERFLDGGYLWEDVRAGASSKVHETLVAFGIHRHKLQGPARHLVNHETLASAWKAVEPFLPKEVDEELEPGIRERRRRERASARAESIVLCERSGLTVAVPLTEGASKWWGRGTRWCTAADNDNAFAFYNLQGPLVVVVLADEKLQLLLRNDGYVQFMDSMDEDVKPEFITDRWSEMEGVLRWACSMNGNALAYVPEKLRDHAMCLQAVRRNGLVLHCVPEHLLDREICLEAVKQNGNALKHVPQPLRDRQMCLETVRQNGFALLEVPEELHDHEICMEAVRRNANALGFVPQELRSYAMCMEAVQLHPHSLFHVPSDLRDRAIYMEAVGRDRQILKHVPPKLRDTEMDACAFLQNRPVARHVQEETARQAKMANDRMGREWSRETHLAGLAEMLSETNGSILPAHPGSP